MIFKGKKVTVMGLGLLGRGIGDAKFLAEQGAELIVTDLKTEEQLADSVAQFSGIKNVAFHLGGHRMEDFENRDFILKAAGVPMDSPYIAHARENGIPIEMSTSLFCSLTKAAVIGVTGTRGKTTTTQFIYEGLKRAGKKVHLGGNIKGVSTLAMLPSVAKDDYVVLELDSWQLQGFGERKISPHIAVFTTFMEDHMNYYKGDMDTYLADKANIFLNQNAGDTLVVGDQCADLILNKYGEKIKGKKEIARAGDIPADWKLQILGDHNKYNIAVGRLALLALGISEQIIKETAESFKGVEGRLEFKREVKGVKIYNDTTATTPQATIVALKALPIERVVLIMGGADKKIDMGELVKEWLPKTKKVILLPGTGTDRIKSEFDFASLGIKSVQAFDLADAVREAMALSVNGDSILFSPAFASFGMFKNEYDRGEKFDEIVEKMK